MQWKEINRSPLIGELNENVFVVGGSDLFLKRIPKENKHILHSIENEYNFLGFTVNGGKFRRRSTLEQTSLTRRAAMLGLRVLPPVSQEGEVSYYRFLEEARTLDEYLPSADSEGSLKIVLQIFNDLKRAHSQGVIYGDRWSHNMLVVPKIGFINIDFDIEISGRPAIEFEVAQAAYYTLSAGKNEVIPVLAQVLKLENGLDMGLIELFLRKHAMFFDKTKFGGIQKETNLLIEMVRGGESMVSNRSCILLG
jgi:hypothetical protein